MSDFSNISNLSKAIIPCGPHKWISAICYIISYNITLISTLWMTNIQLYIPYDPISFGVHPNY